MNELGLHIMDIVYNSIAANATLVTVEVFDDSLNDLIKVTILDNGCGIDKDRLKDINSPFQTGRKSRKVGLGISLFELTAMQCDGSLTITSEINKFTKLEVLLKKSHVNCIPLGDMGEVIYLLTIASDTCEIIYKYHCNNETFIYDSRDIREIVGSDLTSNIEIINWVKNYIRENMKDLEELK